ncbi:MAG: tyrosine-type recombinase/integrase, partial [Planctomycetes bacterium]|nr:tyrosine-type recombinase/integrase [Planctomycetota bacterium]
LAGIWGERAILSKISKRQIEAVRERLAALDPNTCATYERQLAALFHWGERERVIDMAANPVGGCGGDYQPSEKHRPLEAAEVSAIMAVAEGWDRVWAMVSWASGLRPSAVLHLRWESLALDVEPALIRVRPVNPGQWVTVGGVEYPLLAFRVGCGAKNANTYRDYPLPPVAVDVLRRWKLKSDGSPYVLLSLRRLRRLSAGARVGKYPPEPMYGVCERFRKLQVKASAWAAVPSVHWGPPTTPHSWRVTYTKTLEAARISPYVIDTLSGRSSRGNVTAHHYAKLMPEDLQAAADALQAAAVAGGFAEAELGSAAVSFS